MITITGLYCYPVKGCHGISLQTAEVRRMGIRFDRQWMVTDENGMFVAQRQDKGLGIGIKTLCLVTTELRSDVLVLSAPDMPSFLMPLTGLATGNPREVQVWRSHCIATDQGDQAANWFTEYLSRERSGNYRFVRMDDNGVRKAKYGESELAFGDADPFLIISDPSLCDLNSRMTEPLPWDRFRPNIVFDGCDPYAEDHMAHIRIGDIEFLGTKLCVRCPVTTTDQLTAERGKEPLATLATYRHVEDGVVFGRNFNHVKRGHISVGDHVQVIRWD